MKIKYVIFSLCYLLSLNTFAGGGGQNGLVSNLSTNPSSTSPQTETTESAAFKHKQVGLVFNFEETIGTPTFDQHDAQQLRHFLTQKINEYSCDSKNVTFISANYQQGARSEDNMVDDLFQLGYVVLDLSCENTRIVFKISKRDKQLAYAKAVQTNKTDEVVGDCDSCGKVKLSESLINKFKDEDYGGATVIDFGDDSGSDEENDDEK
ncbi:MAG TPA: hypothetical protein PKH93_00780 [Chitinophagales bacterium]|nr:hypothetical protein [Chitinophagales bacterium]HNL06071.1 hypothetical protein [Chitinophagales bacterium]